MSTTLCAKKRDLRNVTRVLVVSEYFFPAQRAGGPVRSLRYLTQRLGNEVDFFVCALDRDLGDESPFSDVVTGKWLKTDGCRIIYKSKRDYITQIRSAVREIAPDIVYLNSFFSASTRHLLTLRAYLGWTKTRFILAPRGELDPGALSIKSWKKQCYLFLGRVLQVFDNVEFHATCEQEVHNIRAAVGYPVITHLATNLTAQSPKLDSESRAKAEGAVRFIFLSRIVPKKNLEFLISVVSRLSGRVDLIVAGPVEDKSYQNALIRLCTVLPENIRVTFTGPVSAGDVWSVLADSHFFVLPTLGENFGHAIVEAWQSGIPVVVSDRTPWRGLAGKNIGWDLALEDSFEWQRVLQRCVNMPGDDYQALRLAVKTHMSSLEQAQPDDQYKAMFNGDQPISAAPIVDSI
jgi:glycosyltransferase involved in cell wall biosynthesis